MTKEITHVFLCPSCDENGTITLPDDMMRFDCPAECGASFLHWQDGDRWKIKCVVQPVFEEVVGPQDSGS